MDIVSLVSSYVEGLLEAEDRFIEHLDSFLELEKTVVELTNRMAAGFLGAVLTTADELICESGVRKKDKSHCPKERTYGILTQTAGSRAIRSEVRARRKNPERIRGGSKRIRTYRLFLCIP